MRKRNYEKASVATAEMNRIRGRVNRLLNWLPNHWYPVFPDRCVIYNDPHRSRRKLLIAWGIDLPPANNGALPRGLEIPFQPIRGRKLQTTAYESFQKISRESPETGR